MLKLPLRQLCRRCVQANALYLQNCIRISKSKPRQHFFNCSRSLSILPSSLSLFPEPDVCRHQWRSFCNKPGVSTLEQDETTEENVLSEKLYAILQKEQDRLEKRILSLEKERLRNLERDDIFNRAQLMVAHLASIPEYTELEHPSCTIKVEGFNENGAMVDLLLNTGEYQNAHEESQELFKIARKMKRGLKIVHEGLIKNETKMLKISDLLDEVREAADDGDISALQICESKICKTLGLKEGSNKKKKTQPSIVTNKIYRLYKGPDDKEILVGRSAAQNDKLTFQVGRVNDLWLHAKHTSGSHVIIKVRDKNNKKVAKETLQIAANLAALHSKSKNMSEVPVLVATRKNLSKPRGANPGAVAVKKEDFTIIGVPADAKDMKELNAC